MAKSHTPLKAVYFNKELIHQPATGMRKLLLLCEFVTAGWRPAIAGVFCYLFGWVSGVIMLLAKPHDGFVRFHAWQSIIVFGAATVPIIVLNLLTLDESFLYWFLIVVYWTVLAFSLCLYFILMWKAYQGRAYELPLVGTLASNLSQTWGSLAGGTARLPVVEEKIKATLVKAPEQEQNIRHDIGDSESLLTEAVKSIIALGETRDPYTAAHQQRVAQFACAIAQEMGLSSDRIAGLRVMGAIHDIGKVAVPAEILSKPGKLNSYEFGIIKTHPEVAHNIVKGLKFPWPVAQAIFQHHERLNGTGYPQGLSGDDIILEARILGVADVVEAMASHRPYRPALGIEKAIEEIAKKKGSLYDANVVEVCVQLFNRSMIQFV